MDNDFSKYIEVNLTFNKFLKRWDAEILSKENDDKPIHVAIRSSNDLDLKSRKGWFQLGMKMSCDSLEVSSIEFVRHSH